MSEDKKKKRKLFDWIKGIEDSQKPMEEDMDKKKRLKPLTKSMKEAAKKWIRKESK